MKLSYLGALVGALGVGLGATALVAGGTMSRATPVATAAVADIATMSIRQRHTLQDMLDLSDGISYDDAARTLGIPGHLQSRRAAGLPDIEDDSRVTVYAWPNPDNSRVVLVFRNDRLIHRTQTGLR